VRRACLLAAVAVLVAALLPGTVASALRLGITDSGGAYFDDAGSFYPLLHRSGARLLRVQLNWGGRLGVAIRKPRAAADPGDRAYDWSRYDRIVLAARAEGIEVVFSVFGTPAWANGGRPTNRAPRDVGDLAEFALAAATRYSGSFRRGDGVVLPSVRLWTAWNEPNLQLGLVPQWRRVGGRWVVQSARDYASICNAIVSGVHATRVRGESVACGVTSARGNNNPRGKPSSVSPIAFMRAMKAAGAAGFDAYAHHPYYGSIDESPSTQPHGRNAVTLANIGVLELEVTRLWGPKPIWITEYGYQTNPPDRAFGVTWAAQARYLTQAVAIARRDSRIAMLLWFLLRDEPRLAGWQSGLITAGGVEKPALAAFRRAAGS
jgi:hypothetical protein